MWRDLISPNRLPKPGIKATFQKMQNMMLQRMHKVCLRCVLKTNTEMTYTLVPENEADLKSAKLSVNSPIAHGLLGKMVGDTVEIAIPAGKITFEIMEINLKS